MTVDINEIRPGDEIDIRLKVAAIRDGEVWPVTSDGSTAQISLDSGDILAHRPRQPAAGDRVARPSLNGTLLAVAAPEGNPLGLIGWVLWDNALAPVNERLADLRRA